VILARYLTEKQMNYEELGHESGGATHALFAWRLQKNLSAGQAAALEKTKKGETPVSPESRPLSFGN
jgi:hypothetical protein